MLYGFKNQKQSRLVSQSGFDSSMNQQSEEERDEKTNEDDGWRVYGGGGKDGGRGGRGVAAATPWAVSRIGRRCTSKRQ